jgi:hypothetical protein
VAKVKGYFASNSSEDSALIYALAAGAAIWLGSYLWNRYNKPNRKLPPLENKKDDDLE